MSESNPSQAAIITSLFIEAVRQGQASWFHVASQSMLPLLRLGDEVYIQPATAHEIGIGEIAAFETSAGLVIHRIVHTQQIREMLRLLQMADVELLPSWVKEQAIVGRVVGIRRPAQGASSLRETNLGHPIAKWWGMVTAHIRYRLYLCGRNNPLRIVLRGCSRFCIHFGAWCIWNCCTSAPAKK
jgi:hypothetical protein